MCAQSPKVTRPARRGFAVHASIVACLFFGSGLVRGATYYVDDANGLDTNPGDANHPWKTLLRAHEVNEVYPYTWGTHTHVAQGDTVYVRDGSYSQFKESTNDNPVNLNYCRRANWITYKAAMGHTPSIASILIYNLDHSTNPYTHGISKLVFDGFTIPGGLYDEGGWYITLQNCDVSYPATSVSGYYAPYYHNNTAAVSFHSDVSDVNVLNCTVHGCEGAIWVGGNYYLIQGNKIHDFCENGVHIGSGDYLTISNNEIYNCQMYSTGVDIYGTVSGTFTAGDSVSQADTGATGVVVTTATGKPVTIYQRSQTHFSTGAHTITDTTNGTATLTDPYVVDPVHTDAVSMQAAHHDVMIDRNIIYAGTGSLATGVKICGSGQATSPPGDALTDITVQNNLMRDFNYVNAMHMLIGANGSGNYATCTRIYVLNNTFIGYGRLRLVLYGVVDRLYNNIISYMPIDDSGVHSGSVTNHGNNFFEHDPSNSWFTKNGTETIGVPAFVHAAGHNYQLAAGSAAIDYGNATYAPATDILGKNRNGLPDAGCYEYGASDPNTEVYTLSVTATHGAVTRSPDQTGYSPNQPVTLQAVAAAGYTFIGWSGDLSGTSNPATILMDGNKSVTASFAANTFTLATSATHGSVARTPDKAGYGYGQNVSLQATPDSGYSFAGWSGDLSGANNPATILMDGNKSVTAKFAGDTCTLSASAVHGSVTTTPDKASYSHSETVVLQAVPDSGYVFVGWSGDLSGTTNPANLTMDTDKSVTAAFAIAANDHTSPSVSNGTPAAGAIQAPLNTLVTLHVTDSGSGVDANSVTIQVNGQSVYSGNTAHYASASGDCRRTGTPADYQYCFQPAAAFGFDQQVAVTVTASDLAGNAMAPYTYAFSTEMRSFGKNWKVSSNPTNSDKAHPACAADSRGDLWIAWHAGQEGSRDIYVTMLDAQTHRFGTAIQLTTNSADQCNPALAVSPDDQVYVVWQDNSRGNWDICGSKTSDGTTWASTARLSDSNDQEVHPVIAVDHSSPPRAYVAWQDHRSGNYDIYVACTDNAFVSQTLWQVTSNAADQTDPAMAISADGTVYLVWTDLRNVSADIYGASSGNGFASNVPMVTASGDQTHPAIAAEPTGSVLHLVWVDDAGNADVYYATCDGLPSGPLTGVDIIDDATGAQQVSPAITASSAGVFACWTDYRRAGSSTDTDLYFADLGSGSSGTNVLVGDERTNSNQAEPALGVDSLGHPFVVWTDSRNTHAEIYLAGNTYVKPEPFRSSLISASEGGTVGTPPAAVDSNDDVSVVLPAGACASDMTVSISQIENTPATSLEFLAAYDFGPSGAQFNQPVTVTIPYTVSNASASVTPYWYDPLTDALSQQGITAVNRVVISSTLHALTFKTTHFTQFYLVAEDSQTGSGGGGGGCSLAPAPDDGQVLEFLIPYIGLAVAMAGLRVRDRSRQSGKRSANG